MNSARHRNHQAHEQATIAVMAAVVAAAGSVYTSAVMTKLKLEDGVDTNQSDLVIRLHMVSSSKTSGGVSTTNLINRGATTREIPQGFPRTRNVLFRQHGRQLWLSAFLQTSGA
jgi:hypothetical protein